jgi:hypothetical protein
VQKFLARFPTLSDTTVLPNPELVVGRGARCEVRGASTECVCVLILLHPSKLGVSQTYYVKCYLRFTIASTESRVQSAVLPSSAELGLPHFYRPLGISCVEIGEVSILQMTVVLPVLEFLQYKYY